MINAVPLDLVRSALGFVRVASGRIAAIVPPAFRSDRYYTRQRCGKYNDTMHNESALNVVCFAASHS